jgi:hypothetical protein
LFFHFLEDKLRDKNSNVPLNKIGCTLHAIWHHTNYVVRISGHSHVKSCGQFFVYYSKFCVTG